MRQDMYTIFRSLLRVGIDGLGGRSTIESTLRRSAEAAVIHGLGQMKSFSTDRALLELMIVVTLAPREAISYDQLNPVPRWKLIQDHVRQDMLSGNSSELEELCRRMAGLLDDWDQGRSQPLGQRRLEGVLQCSICHVRPMSSPPSLLSRDPYKPFHEAPEELLRLERDHVVPVSMSGTRQARNVQVLCRACNLAKGAGLEIPVASELTYASSPLEEVPRAHRFRVLQWVMVTSGGACSVCGLTDNELTMRPGNSNMTLMRANMRAICYQCVTD